MPVYIEPPGERLLFEEDVAGMWRACEYEDQRVLLSILWYSGARVSEVLSLKRKDVNWGVDKVGRGFFEIKFPTKKLGKHSDFIVRERILRSTRPFGNKANLFIEVMIRYCKRLLPEEYLLTRGRSREWVSSQMHRLSKTCGHVWSSMHFRHSVFSHLARNGMTVTGLMYWKGASDIGSVSAYLWAVPQMIEIENQRRSSSLQDPDYKPSPTIPLVSMDMLNRYEKNLEMEKIDRAEKEIGPCPKCQLFHKEGINCADIFES